MNGNVHFDPTDLDEVQMNPGASTIQCLCDLKPLTADGQDGGARMTLPFLALEAAHDPSMYVGFHIWSNKNNNWTQHIARPIVGRLMQLHKDFFLLHVWKYRRAN